ncbi:MAG: XdhC family protein [Bacteroidales bacterium]|nr:XdhC family protein [Bacteroidales bacterium]
MTSELKQLIQIAASWQLSGKKIVMATVVHLEGSSYRRPGVRMIISEQGDTFGAVSGGCVEKNIQAEAKSVFSTGKPKIMNYDGSIRIGCDGIIYLLLEPFHISKELIEAFNTTLENRQSFKTEACYYVAVGEHHGIGSTLHLDNKVFSINPSFHPDHVTDQERFSQTFPPIFQLYIFGAEHDAVHLCKAANLLGWEITIVASPVEAKSIDFFPGANRLINPTFEELDTSGFDDQTAIILMSHSFNKDVQYLMALRNIEPAYFGLLGPKHRRDRVITKFLDYFPDTSPEFFEQIHGPAGINIGAESASEIAVSILAEILSVIRNKKPIALKDKIGSIHG